MEVKIEFRGALREKAEQQIALRPDQHEKAKEPFERSESNIVLTDKAEADAVDALLDRVWEWNDIDGNQKKALQRVNSELIEAKGEFIKP